MVTHAKEPAPKRRSKKSAQRETVAQDDLVHQSLARHRDEAGQWAYDDESMAIIAWEWEELYGFKLSVLDDCLCEQGWESPLDKRNVAALLERRFMAIEAWRSGNEALAEAWLNYLHIAIHIRQQGLELRPLAQQGVKFLNGRKIGTTGTWRNAIAERLGREPKARTAELWRAFKERPPKGWVFIDSTRFGPYFMGPEAGQEFKLSTFQTYAWQERKKLQTG